MLMLSVVKIILVVLMARLEPWLDTSTPDPDTTPTLPRHLDTPTPVSTDTRSDTPTPVSGQCQAISTVDLLGQCQWCQVGVKTNRHSDTLSTLLTPPTLRHSDTTGLDANIGRDLLLSPSARGGMTPVLGRWLGLTPERPALYLRSYPRRPRVALSRVSDPTGLGRR